MWLIFLKFLDLSSANVVAMVTPNMQQALAAVHDVLAERPPFKVLPELPASIVMLLVSSGRAELSHF